jgi:hypothetical protein
MRFRYEDELDRAWPALLAGLDDAPKGKKDTAAWVLTALSCHEDAMTAGELAATCDWVNHAVPGTDELAGALRRLRDAGFVTLSAEGITPTREVERFRHLPLRRRRDLAERSLRGSPSIQGA